MNKEEEIAHFIVERVNAGQKILGAKLGASVAERFPEFQQQFGKLRPFIQKFCGGAVKIVGHQGNDDFYAPASAPEAAIDAARIAEEPESAWRAFTTPGTLSNLCVNTESGEIRVRRSGEPELLPPWTDVQTVTPDEHRRIASEFLPQIDEQDRQTFQHLIQLPDFWQQWFTQTRAFEGGKYSKGWLLFRFNKLCELFLQRLKSLGVGEVVAVASLERLKELKSESRKARETSSIGSPDSAIWLRTIARAALETMSEEELRRLWLPLGLVADAVRRRHSQ